MQTIAHILFVLGFVSVFIVLPLSYQMIKWHDKNPKRWATFQFDSQVQPEDLRFSALTSNFIIGKREIPYPVYKKLSHLNSSFQEWLSQIPVDKDSKQTDHGSVNAVNAPSVRRKIFSSSLTTLKLAGLLSLPLCNAAGITFSTHKSAVFLIWIIIIFGILLLETHSFNVWSASQDGLLVGRWLFKLSIPWSDICDLKMGFPEINKSGSRGSIFTMHLQFGDRTLEIRDGKFISIFSIYRAVSAFRPDLTISTDVNKKRAQALTGAKDIS